MPQLFRDLIAWQKAMQLAKAVYSVSEAFPRDEIFGLRAQVRRAAVSIPSNIAEGYARFSDPELIRFLHITRGSLAEVETQLLLACDFGYVSSADCERMLCHTDELGRIITGLIASRSQSMQPVS